MTKTDKIDTLIKTKNDKIDTLFKTKIPKNIPWLAARPHWALIREYPPPGGVISRLHSSFHMSTLIIVRFKICTVNVTKSGTIRYLAYYPLHGGQTLPKKDGERKY